MNVLKRNSSNRSFRSDTASKPGTRIIGFSTTNVVTSSLLLVVERRGVFIKNDETLGDIKRHPFVKQMFRVAYLMLRFVIKGYRGKKKIFFFCKDSKRLKG